MDVHAFEDTRNPRAAIVGHQHDLVPARDEFLGKRVRRDHVPAGAAGGEKKEPLHRVLFQVTT